MSITPLPETARKVHIYQLCNRSRLESLIVITSDDAGSVEERLRREPPPEAVRWTSGDNVEVEIMAQHMTEPAAEQFLTMFLDHMQRRTWRFKVWRI